VAVKRIKEARIEKSSLKISVVIGLERNCQVFEAGIKKASDELAGNLLVSYASRHTSPITPEAYKPAERNRPPAISTMMCGFF